MALKARASGFVVVAGVFSLNNNNNNNNNNSVGTVGNESSEGAAVGAVGNGNSETEGAANLSRSGCHVIQLDVTKQKDIDKAAKKLDQILEEEGNYTFFFIRTPFFSPGLDVLIFLGFEPQMFLSMFLSF